MSSKKVNNKQNHIDYSDDDGDDDNGDGFVLFGGDSKKRKRENEKPSTTSSSTAAKDAEAPIKLINDSKDRNKIFNSSTSSKTDRSQEGEDEKEMEERVVVKKEMDVSFPSLGLSPWICSIVSNLGMKYPTPIQLNCIPATLQGYPVVIGCSPTGTGKTAAFALPILEQLSKEVYGVFAVVLTPTRELAIQIDEQFVAFGAPINVKCEVVIGGLSDIKQSQSLRRLPHIVVATPGRLAQHLRVADPPRLAKAKFLVLDESDRLLDSREVCGFRDDIETIASAMATPAQGRQTLFYSATTMPRKDLVKAAQRLCLKEKDDGKMKFDWDDSKTVFEWQASVVQSTADTILEEYILVPNDAKHAYLAYILRYYGPATRNGLIETGIKSSKISKKMKDLSEPSRNAYSDPLKGKAKSFLIDMDNTESVRAKSIIIFASTCEMCYVIQDMLQRLEVGSLAIHGELTQGRRMAALQKFRTGTEYILVATDVASRGLDIPEVDMVINYDVPRDPVNYIHRIGRTGRATRKGRAITFVTQFDLVLMQAIEKKIQKQVAEFKDKIYDDDVIILLNKTTKAFKYAKYSYQEKKMKE